MFYIPVSYWLFNNQSQVIMVLTHGSLASDGVEAVVDHHQAVVLPGLSHPTQRPPSEGRRGRDSGTRGREGGVHTAKLRTFRIKPRTFSRHYLTPPKN